VIRWDDAKERWLRSSRGVSFHEVAEIILAGEYLDVLENSARPSQNIFVLRMKGYVWVVPFILDPSGDIILKTAYPSRKMAKRYGGKDAKAHSSE